MIKILGSATPLQDGFITLEEATIKFNLTLEQLKWLLARHGGMDDSILDSDTIVTEQQILQAENICYKAGRDAGLKLMYGEKLEDLKENPDRYL